MSSQQDFIKIIPSPLERSVDRFAASLVPTVPQWVLPNYITLAGFVAGLGVALSFYLASFNPMWFWVAFVGLSLHMVADSLDGAVARQRQLTSQGGYFLDQFLDTLTFIFISLAISLTPYAPLKLMALGAILYPLHMMVILHWINLRKKWIFPKIGPCECHLILMALAVLTFFWQGSVVQMGQWSLGWFDLAGLIATPLIFFEILSSAYQLFRELNRGEAASHSPSEVQNFQ